MSEVANETGRPSDLFEEAERTRIAQLALGQPDSETSTYIEAVVSLIWPYSSQIGAFSLLLAEPDVRLRNAKGQLKVTFHGHGAREVAKSQVGIGDTVRLRLAYAEWTNTGEAVSTPGKKVEWDLHFKNRLVLEVRRNGKKLATIDYERGNTPPPTPEASPSPSGKLLVRNQSDRGTIAFGTPVSVTTKRISSGSFIDASLDPFADDDGFVLGKGRKRTKFGRTSGAWKLVDDEADGVEAKQHSPEVIVIDDSSTPETNPVESSMPPPLTLFGIAPSKTGNVVPEAEEDIVDSLRKLPRQPREDSPETEKNTVTPRIHPLTSPGLPLVSPLVKNVGASIGYFGPQPLESSQLDAISLTPTSPREVTVSSEVELDEMGRREEAESFVQATEIAPVPEPELLLVDDDNGAPSDIFATNLEKQTTGFGNVAVESPFGLPSSGFAGFSSESNALTSTSFNTTKTPLAVPPTLFGIPPNPALFSFQPSAGLGQSTASGFGAFSGSSRELPFDQPRRTPDRQDFGLKTSRERDDEDMYGPEHAMHVINDEEDIGTPAASQTKHREPEPLSVADDGTGEEYSNNLGELRTHDTTMGTIREQLLTPDNTQQDPAQELSQAAFQQVTSLQMPPTPDNTQEPAYAAMLNFDGTSDLRPVQQLEEQIAVVRSAETEQTIEIRDIDTIFNVKAVSSPYFNARESPRLPPERQVEATDKPKSQEVVHKHMREEHAMTEHDEVEAPSPPTLKSRLSTLGMITPLSYYTPLPNLPEHFSQLVDVLAVCTDNTGQPTRSKAGPKDYKITLHLTDMYLERPSTITAQVFRPFESALPSVRRGDVVLLRAFKVQSQKHRMVLLSMDSSAWAVFSSPDAPARTIEPYGLHVATPGPPVEYGLEEYIYAKRLMEWWDKTGAAEHPLLPPTPGDDATAEPETRPASRRFPTPPQSRAKAGLAGDAAPTVTNGNTDADKSESTKPNPARTTRSSRRTNITTNDMNNEQDTRDQFAPLSPIHKPTSPKVSRRTMNKTGNEANADYPSSQADPTSPIRATRSSRRVANRTDHVANSEEPDATDTIEPLPEMPSPKVGRRTRRSTSVISATPEPTRSLRSHSTVHELRDGTKYADGRVPTKKDGVHELRDGTKYVDENVSPVGMAVNEREERVVHELQDGTNYVDRMRSKSPEVRRSARNTGRRGGSLVHELRDGARYTDG